MRLPVVASTFVVLLLTAVAASAQRPLPRSKQSSPGQWHAVESKEVQLRLRLPPQWQTKPATKNARPCLDAISPKATIYLHACSFRNSELSLDDLLDRTLDDLGIELDDDPGEERINGLDALVGETTASVGGRDVGMFLVVASYGDTRYVITIMTKASLFDANARTMNRIVDSLSPNVAGPK